MITIFGEELKVGDIVFVMPTMKSGSSASRAMETIAEIIKINPKSVKVKILWCDDNRYVGEEKIVYSVITKVNKYLIDTKIKPLGEIKKCRACKTKPEIVLSCTFNRLYCRSCSRSVTTHKYGGFWRAVRDWNKFFGE